MADYTPTPLQVGGNVKIPAIRAVRAGVKKYGRLVFTAAQKRRTVERLEEKVVDYEKRIKRAKQKIQELKG